MRRKPLGLGRWLPSVSYPASLSCRMLELIIKHSAQRASSRQCLLLWSTPVFSDETETGIGGKFLSCKTIRVGICTEKGNPCAEPRGPNKDWADFEWRSKIWLDRQEPVWWSWSLQMEEVTCLVCCCFLIAISKLCNLWFPLCAVRREIVTSIPSSLHLKLHKAFITVAQFSGQAHTYLGFSSSCIFKSEHSFYTNWLHLRLIYNAFD